MQEALREKALALPMKPGVYMMYDADGQVIYVGKAKLLKNRVCSYFRGSHNAKTEAMISKIADFQVIIADSEWEALVLENSLIKHHSPKYNILLKDDKGYPFIRLDIKSEYPRFSVVGKRKDDDALYFGPYGGRGLTFSAIDALCKTLKLPTCSKKFPRDIGKERACLNHHMGFCDAYCRSEALKESYQCAIKKAVMILQGKTKELLSELRGEMETAAENLRFEEAAEKRDMINALTKLETQQHVWSKGSSDTDAVGFYRGAAKSCFVVLHYIQGKLLGKDMELLPDTVGDDADTISQILRQYYIAAGTVPKTVLLPIEAEDIEELEKFFSELSGHAVSVQTPKRGYKREYSAAAQRNAKEEVERATSAEERESKTARWLMDSLHLPKPPVRIEAFDISNTGNEEIVASMTVFERGRPKKGAYRKFKIKTTNGADDYGSMREAVGRRFRRYAEGDEKFAPLPDLLLIDGGAAHARAAAEAMEQAGFSVPIFGMVKDDRHRTRALKSPDGHEIGLSSFPAAFAFVGNIQEETHRFAIEFHRSRRGKTVSSSGLDSISGVGEKRKTELLRHFKSIRAISEASVEELSMVVPKNIAEAVYKHFHEKSGE